MKNIKNSAVGFLSLMLFAQPLAAGAAEVGDIKMDESFKRQIMGI